MKNKITPFLTFNNQAEEAMNFYTAIFKNSKKGNITRYPEGTLAPAGSVMVASFELDGQAFTALNAGPMFEFTGAISFTVDCDNQEEIDYYWDKLTAGGSEVQCGWLKDKFGVSWQVVPKNMGQLMSGNGDPAKAQRAMQAMLKMKKLEIKKLQEA